MASAEYSSLAIAIGQGLKVIHSGLHIANYLVIGDSAFATHLGGNIVRAAMP